MLTAPRGRRVQKTTASGAVYYVYDIAGHQIEVNSSGVADREEVYAGGRHLATYTNNTTYFDHADWLGTERMRTTASGSSCETIVSLPFGDGEATTGSCSDASPMHFTGKMHDDESGLDDFGARYNTSTWGRFMSVDPSRVSAEPYSPQSWNRYTYTLDNPLGYVDHNGLWPTSIHNEIYAAVFGGALSQDQVSLIERVSAQQDSLFGGGQSAKSSNSHAMCSPGQSMAACKSGIANHIRTNLANAKAIGDKKGLTNEALTYFAVAAHTLTDEGSPEH